MTVKGDILVVDDSPAFLALISGTLTEDGYNVRTADSGESALAAVAVKIPEIILLDIRMPGLGGLEVFKRLKARPETSELPVIFLSGVDDASERLKGLNLGAVDFISKTFHRDELLAKIRTHTELYRLRAECERQTLAISQERELFAKLLEQVPGVVYQYRLYQDGRSCFPYASPGMNDIYEVTPEEVREDAATAFGRIHPDDLESTAAAIQDSARTLKLFHWEFRVVLPRQGLRWRMCDARPERLPDGSTLWYGIISDITERVQVETERERLSKAIEQAGEIVIITDIEGNIQYVNPAFETVTGYSRLEVIGKNPRILKSGKHDNAFHRGLWESIASGRTWAGRIINKRKDGTFYTEESTISAVKDPAGKIVNYVAVTKDITEQLRLESQFFQAQKMEAVGLLAGGIAHDFNNILTAIKGYCGLVAGALSPEDPKCADMGEIMGAADRATTLTRQLLAFSRQQIIDPKVTDLNRTFGDMTRMLSRIIGENVKLSTKLCSAPCLARVDQGLIEQVVMNLVVNARDAVSKDGEIKLETEILLPPEEFFSARPALARGRMVCIKVRDNGSGMSPEVKKHLFEPFYTTKAQGKGTGLGLSMVYGTVKQSGGEIVLESEPGKGSVFELYFPLVEGGIADNSAGKAQESPKKGTETILFVEDEDSLRRLGERQLRMSGYTVISAADGKEALEAAGRHGKPMDLLITDVVMPGMSGRELAAELARRKLVSRTLFMSGYTDDSIAKHGVLEPGIAFLYKPFTFEALSVKIREVLDGPAAQARA